MVDTAAVIEQSTIDMLIELGGGDELLKELVEIFFTDMPTRMEELVAAVAAEDCPSIERLCHSMKSSCANLGAMGLAEFCRQMEEGGRNNTFDPVPAAHLEFLAEYERVRTELGNIVA